MMMQEPDDEGFGLVEMVIAFFLLALIAVAMLPALVSGIRYSAQQSTTATATRALNAKIEQLREQPSCAAMTAAASGTTVSDGRGGTITLAGPGTPPATPSCTSSTSGAAVPITLAATQGTTELARVSALIYLP